MLDDEINRAILASISQVTTRPLNSDIPTVINRDSIQYTELLMESWMNTTLLDHHRVAAFQCRGFEKISVATHRWNSGRGSLPREQREEKQHFRRIRAFHPRCLDSS